MGVDFDDSCFSGDCRRRVLVDGADDCRLTIADCRLQIADCRICDCWIVDLLQILIGVSGVFLDLLTFSMISPRGSCLATGLGMSPQAIALQKRTREFLKGVIVFCEKLPSTDASRRIVPQLIDSAGSTDSNYRAACRGRSRKEFIAKIGVAAEEADESKGWLEALLAAEIGNALETMALIKESDELIAIFVASQKTAKKNDAIHNNSTIHNKSKIRNRK
jgi:four helix bundle protein